MNGLQGIKNINASRNAAPAGRYQAQFKGDANGGSWYIFDSATGGWGQTAYAKAKDAQDAADALNV